MAPLSSPTFKNTQHQEAGKQNVPSMLSQQIIQKERFFTSKIQQLNEMDKEFDFRKSASEGTAVSKSSDCRSGIVDKCQRYACSDKTLQAMINNKLTKKRCENEHNWEVKQRAEARLHESLCRLLGNRFLDLYACEMLTSTSKGLPKVTIHLRLELGPEHTIKLMERVESELLAVREDMGEDERYAEEEWIRFQQAARENQRKWARSQDPGQCLFCTDIPRDTRPRKIALHKAMVGTKPKEIVERFEIRPPDGLGRGHSEVTISLRLQKTDNIINKSELRTYHDKGVGRMIVEKLAKERDENKHHWAAVQRADALIREGICRIYGIQVSKPRGCEVLTSKELPTGLITLPLAIPAEKKMELLSRIESKEPALQKNADKNKTSQAAEGRDKMMPEADGLVSDDDIIWEDEA
ncbi:hypothetical protein IWZ01DRAFT_561390 [Phyllosticta capitalensis]